VQYGSLKDRLEELIEKYREGRYDERETIEELRELMDKIRSRDKQARKRGLRDETDLSFYHAVENVLGDHEAGEEEAIELTGTLVETVEGFVTKVEWKERTHLQNQMRKAVTRDLYRSEIEFSTDQRQELTNRVIELARAHYQ
jgi:type I restriction enzyme R subunit